MSAGDQFVRSEGIFARMPHYNPIHWLAAREDIAAFSASQRVVVGLRISASIQHYSEILA